MLVPGSQSQARSATDIRIDEGHHEWRVSQHRSQNEDQLYHQQVSGEGIQIVVDEPIDTTNYHKQGAIIIEQYF